jgi:hypothetical protein
MATEISGSIVPLHQPKAPLTPAERARAYRKRKKAGTAVAVTAKPVTVTAATLPVTATSRAVTASRRPLASTLLTIAAVGLTAVGVAMNGSFAHGLGSNAVSGFLFLTIGVAADLCALAVPSCAASMWQARRRGTALVAWAVWSLTFAFTITAGLGFASVNIAEVTASRASRVTPAVMVAQTALADATASRDRECISGAGKFCRVREMEVTERRKALDVAMQSVQQAADPQTDAAIKAVAWLTLGLMKPSGDDFAMVRLVLLALFPQIGGLLLMVARNSAGLAPQLEQL